MLRGVSSARYFGRAEPMRPCTTPTWFLLQPSSVTQGEKARQEEETEYVRLGETTLLRNSNYFTIKCLVLSFAHIKHFTHIPSGPSGGFAQVSVKSVSNKGSSSGRYNK